MVVVVQMACCDVNGSNDFGVMGNVLEGLLCSNGKMMVVVEVCLTCKSGSGSTDIG